MTEPPGGLAATPEADPAGGFEPSGEPAAGGIGSEAREADTGRRFLASFLFVRLRPFWPWIVLAVVTVVGWGELRRVDVTMVRGLLRSTEPRLILALLAATAFNLAIAGLYDVLALGPLSRPPRAAVRWGIGLISFAWSNFLTLGPLAGPGLRFWLYAPHRVGAPRARSALGTILIAFSLGLCAWCAVVLVPLPVAADSLGARIALALPAGGLLAGLLASLPRLRWARSLAWGGKGRAAALSAVALADWLLAWVVFHLALSGFHGGIPATLSLRAFFLGQLAGMVSFIPGGLGTADAVWILTLAGAAGGHDRILAGLLMYRCVYYVLPWLLATLTLAGHMVRTGPRFGWLLRSVIASYTFLCGVVLLASAATPSLADRAAFLNRTVPLAVVEISHGASVVLGFLMLIVARGLMRGYRSSHRIALALFFGGALATFLKGLDYEEALLALVAAACLIVLRRAFERKGSMHASLEFALPVGVFAIVLFAAIGLGSFSALPAPGAALTTFAPFAQDTRFVRALFVLVSIAILLVALLAQRARSRDRLPGPEEIARAVDEARSLGKSTNPLLVAVGDKSVFRPAPAGFMAYRTIGPFLVAFSEPVCPEGKEREFLAAFLDFAAEQDRDAVLYQITPALLPAAHDLGFSLFKLGEEGIVDLGRFDLKGNKAKGLRSSVNRVEKAGGRFELVDGAAIEALLPELREVSDAWLAAKGASEKWFSIGRFDEAYLRRFPCAVVRDGEGRIAAFANILEGAGGDELSFDLMRYRGDNVMDYLFVRLMLHAKERGFSRFNLGMAPLSAVGEDRRARPFERLARLLFRHGEHWYNYQGLRRYKEKFDPVWEPRYMAYPSPWQWPVAIANVTVLISGGWRALLVPGRRSAA